jgi:predicted transglutaminase-like cysteine proteinase
LRRRSFFGIFFALSAGLAAAGAGSLSRDGHAAGLDELVTAARNPAAIFGSVEISSSSFKALPQWARVLKSMQSELPVYRSCLRDSDDCRTAGQKSWRKVISAATGLGRREKLRMVNKFFNTWPYKYDQELYGVTEYWASLTEFLRRSGDCEDYSIAKYYALKELGFTSDEMRIIILLDEIRNIGHAVLAVYIEDEILILDSLSDLVLPHSMYKHYVPQYSMNETRRWAHITG